VGKYAEGSGGEIGRPFFLGKQGGGLPSAEATNPEGSQSPALANLIRLLDDYFGDLKLSKEQVGLGNVDNTSDVTKSENYATSALVADPKRRTIEARALDQEILLTDGASVLGDDSTDCLVGINNCLAAAKASGRPIVVPPGKFRHSGPIAPITGDHLQMRGHGKKSIFRPDYAAGDIFTLGDGASQVSGVIFRDFAIWPKVQKTSGYSLNARLASRFLSENVFYGSLEDYVASGNAHRMADGLYFDRFAECQVKGGQIAGAGYWFKARGNADQSFGAELTFDEDLRVVYGLGGVVGGACGGIYFGRLDVSNALVGVTIDQSLRNTNNREVFFSDQCTIDTCVNAAVIIDQTTAAAMQVMFAHGWLCSTQNGPGLWIKNANGARITVDAKLYNNNGDALRVDDPNAYIEVPDSAFFDINKGWGINPTVPTNNLKIRGPRFLANTLGRVRTDFIPEYSDVGGVYIRTDGDAGFRLAQFNAFTDGSGNLTTPHGLGGNAMKQVLGATALVRSGGAGSAGVPMTFAFIDGTNISFTGGAPYASKPVNVCVFVSAVVNPSW
jgi:hypothetical protein